MLLVEHVHIPKLSRFYGYGYAAVGAEWRPCSHHVGAYVRYLYPINDNLAILPHAAMPPATTYIF